MDTPEEDVVEFPVSQRPDAIYREIEEEQLGTVLDLAQQGDEQAIAEIKRRTEAGDFDV
jgi:hypothetical protein